MHKGEIWGVLNNIKITFYWRKNKIFFFFFRGCKTVYCYICFKIIVNMHAFESICWIKINVILFICGDFFCKCRQISADHLLPLKAAKCSRIFSLNFYSPALYPRLCYVISLLFTLDCLSIQYIRIIHFLYHAPSQPNIFILYSMLEKLILEWNIESNQWKIKK